MEKLNKILVTVGGILYLLFGLFHITFFNFFQKDQDFAKIKPFLSKIIQMLNLGVIVFFVSLGIVILVNRNEILNTKLGRSFLFASSAFFLIRGAAELFFPNYVIPLMITMLFCSVLYLIPALGRK